MYIGLKQIQNQLTDYPTLLTSSDGIHALTGWSKLQDAPQPLTIHLLYTCVYTPELLSYPFIPDKKAVPVYRHRNCFFCVLFLIISIWICSTAGSLIL